MNYKSTLNLPKTNFPMKANLPGKEPDMIDFWKKQDIYGRIREQQKGRKKYILHDGPPYANGLIHMGHALNKILKDIVIRFNNMRGHDAPYIPGWDCHGLPVEHQLMKELKLKKGMIDQVEFRKKARDYAMKFVEIQKEEFKRLGIFGDWDNPYLTLTREYEAEIIKSFAMLVKDGYVYNDLKPVNWCTTCETALAEAEVEYENHTSPSIYVKFKVNELNDVLRHTTYDIRNTYFIIWTTTPWTLLANVAIAVHPDMEYAVCEVDGEEWIIAESLAESFFKKIGKQYKVLKKSQGRQFENMKARHPFMERQSNVVLANYVSHEDGTGCVHTAPGHGQEDYLTGKKYNLPMIMPVDHKGIFDSSCGEFSGQHVVKANEKIIERLKRNGALVWGEKVQHSYPHCWRCKKPIIFRATEQWFMKIDHKNLRGNLLDAIKSKVKWLPESGQGRMFSMVEGRPDWCLSRQRYWGVPIPVFYCKTCGTKILDHGLIMHVAELVKAKGVDVWFSDKVEQLLPEGFQCPECTSKDIKRENDILDVWFESGVSHTAVLKNNPALDYPCELYLEGSDQHRGWFQSSLITALAINGKPPYKSVLTHGFIVDGEGKKMSKSLGNVVRPQDIMKQYGADILRLWVSSSNYSDDIRISDEIIKRQADAYRKIRNTLRYLLSNLNDFDSKKDAIRPGDVKVEIDRWMLSRLSRLVADVTDSYDNFIFHKVYRLIYNFCIYEVSSFYLDVLKDRLYTFKKDSFQRRSAQTIIFIILDSLTKMLAPILSFTSEEVWQNYEGLRQNESVHLAAWPEYANKCWINESLDKKWNALIEVREKVLKALEEKRAQNIIGSPLEAKVVLSVKDAGLRKMLKENVQLLPTILIVSQADVDDKVPSGSEVNVAIHKADGKKCQRCWNYSVTVGQDKNHPEICKKCKDNI